MSFLLYYVWVGGPSLWSDLGFELFNGACLVGYRGEVTRQNPYDVCAYTMGLSY